MVIVPTVMNAAVFWVQDNFLKKNKFDRRDANLSRFYEDFEHVVFKDDDETLDQIQVEMKDEYIMKIRQDSV